MRKLFNFYHLCYCYSVFLIMLAITMSFYLLAPLFLLININSFSDTVNKFANKISEICENKAKEITKKEYDILNADLHERCLNGEFGLRLRNLNWWREIAITFIIITCIIVLIHCL